MQTRRSRLAPDSASELSDGYGSEKEGQLHAPSDGNASDLLEFLHEVSSTTSCGSDSDYESDSIYDELPGTSSVQTRSSRAPIINVTRPSLDMTELAQIIDPAHLSASSASASQPQRSTRARTSPSTPTETADERTSRTSRRATTQPRTASLPPAPTRKTQKGKQPAKRRITKGPIERAYETYQPPDPVPAKILTDGYVFSSELNTRAEALLSEGLVLTKSKKMDLIRSWVHFSVSHWNKLEENKEDDEEHIESGHTGRTTAQNTAMATLMRPDAFMRHWVGSRVMLDLYARATTGPNDTERIPGVIIDADVREWAAYLQLAPDPWAQNEAVKEAKRIIRQVLEPSQQQTETLRYPTLARFLDENIRLQKTATKLGTAALDRVHLLFLNGTDQDKAKESLGKLIVDGGIDTDTSILQYQPTAPQGKSKTAGRMEYHVMDDPAVLNLPYLGQQGPGPFVAVALNREEISKLASDDPMRVLLESIDKQEKTWLTKSERKELNLDTLLAQHPRIVETIVIDLNLHRYPSPLPTPMASPRLPRGNWGLWEDSESVINPSSSATQQSQPESSGMDRSGPSSDIGVSISDSVDRPATARGTRGGKRRKRRTTTSSPKVESNQSDADDDDTLDPGYWHKQAKKVDESSSPFNTTLPPFFERVLLNVRQGARVNIKNRLRWKRGKSRAGEAGIPVATQSRVDHFGRLSSYANFVNQAGQDKIAQSQIGDDWALDLSTAITQKVFPSFVNFTYETARAAGLPPRGGRGFSITGAVSYNYLSTSHEEPLGDPLWTLGMVLWRSKSLVGHPDFGMAYPGLHKGRGLVIRPSRQYCWMWKGGVNAHGGVFGSLSAEAIENKKTNHEVLVSGMYQKRRPLNYGHRYLRGYPSVLDTYYRKLALQNNPHVMGWHAL